MDGLDPTLFQKFFGDSALIGVLFLFVKTLWASKQEDNKALIAYLESSKRDDLASQAKQIESYDRLTEVMGDLKDSIEKRNADDDHRNQDFERRLTTVETKVFSPVIRNRPKAPAATG